MPYSSTTTARNSPSDLPTLPSPNPTQSFWHKTHPNPLVHHRTTPHLPKRANVVIIGSGITGVFAARELLIAGSKEVKDVVVLEARQICSGATGRNGGHCQALLYLNPPSSARFEIKNVQFLTNLISDSNIPCDFFPYPHGSCHAYYSRQAFDEAKAAIWELGSASPGLRDQIEIIEKDRAKLASLRVPHAVGAILQSHAAGLHPYKLVTWLWGQLLQSSKELNLQTGTPVLSISPCHGSGNDTGDRWTLHTPRGMISTPHVLFATNSYTAHLLPDSFRSLIVPVRGQMSALKPPDTMLGRPLEHDYSFVGKEQDDYLVQRPVQVGGHLMFGGGRRTTANRGVGVSDDAKIDERVARYLRTIMPKVMDLKASRNGCEDAVTITVAVSEGWEYAEALEGSGKERELYAEAEWTGVMGYSRDGCPWVGGVPGQEGLWVCGGYTGHGMPNACLSAIHVARLITANSGRQDWREVEKAAIASEFIPASYVITEERMHRARQMPEVKRDLALLEAKL